MEREVAEAGQQLEEAEIRKAVSLLSGRALSCNLLATEQNEDGDR